MRILGTIFAGLFGLIFGSFLNVCLTRWPEGESVVKPRSRCRTCGRTLTWWENVPVISWLALRGRCRTCGVSISARYILVELSVGALWAWVAFQYQSILSPNEDISGRYFYIAALIARLIFYWVIVALAVLDAGNLWLPDWLTVPGILAGFFYSLLPFYVVDQPFLIWAIRGRPPEFHSVKALAIRSAIAIIIAMLLILLIRWLYQLIRHKEGLGLGDAKLMAMLAAWLGLPGALLAFFIGIVIGAFVAIAMLVTPNRNKESWATSKLPLGTFLCIGGIISSLWGQQIIDAYLRLSGF
ncbi:prepilin peptidase [Terracidiphilus sp.]|jgi:leader peptidase (prepilin peptidase)/N-methyltransferase|uniref:prepilin peptidase n=1 Tax=Terracidiphilus sp. TaxID=1964191 RepID=UPI003C166F1C